MGLPTYPFDHRPYSFVRKITNRLRSVRRRSAMPQRPQRRRRSVRVGLDGCVPVYGLAAGTGRIGIEEPRACQETQRDDPESKRRQCERSNVGSRSHGSNIRAGSPSNHRATAMAVGDGQRVGAHHLLGAPSAAAGHQQRSGWGSAASRAARHHTTATFRKRFDAACPLAGRWSCCASSAQLRGDPLAACRRSPSRDPRRAQKPAELLQQLAAL
jgi:hypothetical protein